jgi:hypothetical protein
MSGKIVIPDGMFKAALEYQDSFEQCGATLEAALRWWAESDDGNLECIVEEWDESRGWPAVDLQALKDFFRFAKRRMFLAPEPEYCPTCGLRTDNRMGIAPEPEYIGSEEIGRFCGRFQRIDEAVREAYRRGQSGDTLPSR